MDRWITTRPALQILHIVMFGILVTGCTQEHYSGAPASRSSEQATFAEPAAVVGAQAEIGSPPVTSTEGEAKTPSLDTSRPSLNRKIIYNTRLGLVVRSYSEFEVALPRLVESFGGFISQSETSRRYNNQQSGTWTARIPADRYIEFMAGVTGLGFAESRKEDAQDVTDEFVDIEARMRNSRTLEQRIITMLEERTGKISDVLEIERELARVREEIERMEGRLRMLADRTSLATIVIQCREELQYTPPAAPTLASRLGDTWAGSISAMRQVGEALLILIVAVTPWLLLLSIPMFIVARFVWKFLQPKGAVAQ